MQFDFQHMDFQAGSIFTPGAPVNGRDLFAGRAKQVDAILDAVSQRGYHAVLYGERGVGKTSLANVLASFIEERTRTFLIPRVNCDASDTFTSIWRKAFQDIRRYFVKEGVGFGAQKETVAISLLNELPEPIKPDDVRRVLTELSVGVVVIVVFDEFDRIESQTARTLMADTIKSLSDYAVSATILLIGVADSLDDLVAEHHSIERALVQVPMPRMSSAEIRDIVEQGVHRLNMSITADALSEIVRLSQGLPYITHLLALHSTRSAIAQRTTIIDSEHIELGVSRSVAQWQQTIVTSYYGATKSQQPGNIYPQVLLACAMAQTDELGFFSAAAVRAPLRAITLRQYDIPNFARHLKEFSEAARGNILQREGSTRKLRYRFKSPIMRPYIVMRGLVDGLVSRKDLPELLSTGTH